MSHARHVDSGTVRAMFRLGFVCLTACATATVPSAGDHETTDAGQQVSRPDAGSGRPDAPTNTGSGTGSGSNTQDPCAFTGTLATFDFSTESGSETTVAAKTTATGITTTAFKRSAALTANTGAGSINSSNWPTGTAADPSKYYAFTITAPTGCGIAISSLAIDAKASTTGPANASVGTDADSFASLVTISTAAPSTPALAAQSHGTLEVRIYGYGAVGATGTLRVQNTLTVTGSTM